jgi:hypothetical protein
MSSAPRSMREKVKDEILEIQKHNPRFKPGLAIVQVGDRPDSTTYVRMKGKAAQEVMHGNWKYSITFKANIKFTHQIYPDEVSQQEVFPTHFRVGTADTGTVARRNRTSQCRPFGSRNPRPAPITKAYQ